MNRRTMIAGAVVAVAVLALPTWEIVAPAYRQAHGCTKLFGVWWGVPEFDSTWFCPWDINRSADLDYLYRALGVNNGYDAARVIKEQREEPPKPAANAAEQGNPVVDEPPKAMTRPQSRQPIPAVQVCGPDRWHKDHWEPSCR